MCRLTFTLLIVVIGCAALSYAEDSDEEVVQDIGLNAEDSDEEEVQDIGLNAEDSDEEVVQDIGLNADINDLTAPRVKRGATRSDTMAQMVRRARWTVWTKCSSRCGTSGTQERKKTCKRNSGRKFTCKKVRASCRTILCEYVAMYAKSKWSNCSSRCAKGTRSRVDASGKHNETIDCGMQRCGPLARDRGQKPSSIMFVLDSSASGKRDRSRLWFVIKQFVMDTINAIDLSRATIGATIFSNNIRLALRPKKRSGRVVLQKIWRQRYMAACSNTGEAMRRTAAIMNSRSLRGTKRTIVLVTDGVENIKGGKSALEAAQWARKKGINIVVVGIGESLDEDLFEAIKQINPDASIKVPSYEKLPLYTNVLLRAIFDSEKFLQGIRS